MQSEKRSEMQSGRTSEMQSPKDDREARLRLRLLGAQHCRYIEWHQESDCAQAASSASKGKRAPVSSRWQQAGHSEALKGH
jgi:hypothetical protein